MSVNINGFTFQNLNSPSEVLALKGLVTSAPYDSMSDAEAARAIVERPLVANPNSAAQTPDLSKINAIAMIGKLTDAELALIPEDSLQRVGDDIASLNLNEIAMALRVWKAKSYIDQAKHDELLLDVASTVEDPNHKSQIPGDSPLTTALGRPIGAITVKEVANSKGVS